MVKRVLANWFGKDCGCSTAWMYFHNPRYAGAFCFGKTRSWKDAEGRWRFVSLPREQWPVLIKDAHAGYIDWEQFEENQQRLKHNQQAHAFSAKAGRPGKARPCFRAWLFAASADER